LNEDSIDDEDGSDDTIEILSESFLEDDAENVESESDDSYDEGGTRSIDWPVAFISCTLHSASNTSVPGVQNALLESYGVTGTQFNPVSFSGDYFSIVLPV
ncbi:MAG: hypothetical protein J6X44_00330, partial [Thermoguttaceae bacterium]|nr:hypothetical protein [Thermoguttaceae bacterium]